MNKQKKSALTDTENRLTLARGAGRWIGWQVGRMGEQHKEVVTYSGKIDQSLGYIIQHREYSQ